MEIREVYLEEERSLVREFLNSFDLKLADDLTKTFYVVNDSEDIVGTISCSDYIIKCLAVNPNYQSENLSGMLVSKMLEYFNQMGIYSYQVYTKPVYQKVFESFGFRMIVKTDKVVMLEGGIDNIVEEVKKIKTMLDVRFAPLDEESDIVGIVVNANPMTLGHEYLIEKASKEHKMVVVFVLEEDKSEFTAKERSSMVYLGCHKFGNVCVTESTKYIISKLTFPTYFLKNKEEIDEEYAKCDALIFKNYFMKYLFLKKRYVGSESTGRMSNYNETLKSILGSDLVLVDRLTQDGNVVSASNVRKLLSEGKLNEALDLCPRENSFILQSIYLSGRFNK